MNSIPPRQRSKQQPAKRERTQGNAEEPSKSVGESSEALRRRGFSKHDNIDPSSRTPRPRREANEEQSRLPTPLPEKRPAARPRPRAQAPSRRSCCSRGRAHPPCPCRRKARIVPESMEDKRYQARPLVLPPNTDHYRARPLVLPPNTNRRKTPKLKRPARTRGIDVGLSTRKFVVPFGAPGEPVVAAFNKILVQIYNMIAGLKGLLEEVNVADPQLLQAVLNQVNSEDTEHFGPENKEELCSILRKGVHRLRTKAYTFRCLVTERGSKPINEPLEWHRA